MPRKTTQKKVTIKDIAELANTSKTTVSFYLSGNYHKMSEDTRKRIEAAIEKTHYQPSIAARMLNKKNSKLIGVLIADITNEFSNQLIKGIDLQMKDEEYQMVLANTNYDTKREADLFDRMLKMGVDGFIMQPTTHFFTTRQKYGELSKPIVFIDSQINESQDKWVRSNNYQAVQEAIREMIKIGYEDFLMITADPTVLSTRMERTSGFEDVLNQENIPYDTFIVPEDVTPEQITEYVSKVLKLDRKTLIFVPNCWLLPIVYNGIKRFKNLIPYTIGVMGFDNRDWADFAYPTVTTIVQPAMDEGKTACRILIDTIEGREQEEPNQSLNCTLIQNESTNLGGLGI